MIRNFLAFLIIIVCSITTAWGQTPNDCVNAITVCGNGDINSNASGVGVQELSGNNTCGSQENESLWLLVNVVNSGTLGFTLTPTSSDLSIDYDFFVFGPNVSCGSIGTSIRCSTTNPNEAGLSSNQTGMNDSETDTSEGPGSDGNSFVSSLNVTAGESYYVVIDRPIGTSTFDLVWTGTATMGGGAFADPPMATAPSDLEECSTTGNFPFNLRSTEATIIGSQTGVLVTYHETTGDASDGTDPLPDTYTNTSNPQTIFARVTETSTDCFSITDFELRVESTPDLEIPDDLEACDLDGNGTETFTLTDFDMQVLVNVNPSDFTVSYHLSQSDAISNTGAISTSYTASDNTPIFIRVQALSTIPCFGVVAGTLRVNPLPVANDTTLTQCEDSFPADGISTFDLNEVIDAVTGGATGVSITFHSTLMEAQANTSAFTDLTYTNTVNNQVVYARVVNDPTSCFDIVAITLSVASTMVNNASLAVCDDSPEDGFASFVLSDANADILAGLPTGLSDPTFYEDVQDALTEEGPLPNNFVNSVVNTQTIYARVEDTNNACFGIGEVTLMASSLPEIEPDETLIYCTNTFPATTTLEAGILVGVPSDYTYLWSTGEVTETIDVNTANTYTVQVTNMLGCTSMRAITVDPSNPATIEELQTENFTEDNTITAIVAGDGDYEFAFNFGPFQDSNVLSNADAGSNVVTVRDRNGCGITRESITIINYPKFFTPNGDGFNDTWNIVGIETQPTASIYVFDRFGKLLKRLSPVSSGWDGTFNGNPMPASDYWFRINYIEQVDGVDVPAAFRSHFSLKR